MPFSLFSTRRIALFTVIVTITLSSAWISRTFKVDVDGLTARIVFKDNKAKFDARTVLKGPPSTSYKDNLLPTEKYITSWGSSAGWSNDVISFIHLIYLGQQTNRIPILPAHTSTHLPWSVQGQLTFGEVFDIPRLAAALGHPVLEWDDVKEPNSSEVDKIGCWNIWGPMEKQGGAPRDSHRTFQLKLDISYTPVPDYVLSTAHHSTFASFPALMTLAWPETRQRAFESVKTAPSSYSKHVTPPDEHLLCFDFLYYVGSFMGFEIGVQHSPAWNTVGTHMHWNRALDKIVDQWLLVIFGLPDGATLPPFISIHARHTDFNDHCDPKKPKACFPSIDVFKNEVREMKAKVLEQKGIQVEHVVMTSDETDPAWWTEVTDAGWYIPDHDHLETADLLGDWYPVLIDAVIQSRGIGFIGTELSTMSILAQRRVEDWQGGVTTLLKLRH